jgi:uncharacterized protein YmfQ (DUF2313 family)
MAIIDVNGEQKLLLEQPAAQLQVVDTALTPDVLREFPWGEYFHRTNGWLPRVSRAIARFFSRLLRRKDAFEKNMDPRQADELLDEWEEAYGLDPAVGLTDDDRRDALLARVRNQGGVTLAYYQSVAVDFGYLDAVVTDAADPLTTESLCDDFLQDEEWKLTFKVAAASQGAARDQQLQDLINGQLLAGWFAFYEFA